MKLHVPLASKAHALQIIRACLAVLLGRKAVMVFEMNEVEVDGEQPIMLSREHVKEMRRQHMEAAAKAALLEELVTGILREAPEDNPVVLELRDGLEVINEPRTLH